MNPLAFVMPPLWVRLLWLVFRIEAVLSATPGVAVNRRHLGLRDSGRPPGVFHCSPFSAFIASDAKSNGSCFTVHKRTNVPFRTWVDSSSGIRADADDSIEGSSALADDDTHVKSVGVPISRLKPTPLPIDEGVPLENHPLPPWALDHVTGQNVPTEPYVPRHYSEAEIAAHFSKVNEETRSRSTTRRMEVSKDSSIKSYGFKFKQIQPVRHHNGKAFTFFYVHSLHTDVIPVLLNSLRRVAKRHLGAGRITALRIPGMKNEFYSVVGLREDFFDLSRNLSNVIFRNVPMTATFEKPIIGRLRLKGPIIAVAGHIEIDEDAGNAAAVGSSSGSAEDRKIEIVNKNHYLCALADDAYLDMEVKIEYIANYVINEQGPESLNRDITPDGFIHFCSSCLPVEIFAFSGERRGMDEESTSEIVTLELHTDGSTTPRLALLSSASFLENWFQRTLDAFHTDCKRDLHALEEAKNAALIEELVHHEMYRNVPWNPYRTPDDRISGKHRWFYRKDVKRQYPIDPESKLAKEEQLAEWRKALENEMKYDERIKPKLVDDNEQTPPREHSVEELEELTDMKAPSWVFKDPLGPGLMSQGAIFEFDKDDGPLQFPIE